jgi:hypothetical protein
MRDSKFGLRAFGLALVAALGLMALMAVAAQAENLTDGGKPGLFLVNKEGALAKAGVTFEVNQVGKGTLSVPGRNLGILCEVGTIKGEFKSDTEALGNASFSKCSAWEFVKVEEGKTHTNKLPCTVTEPIVVEKAIALPRKHEGAPYVLLQEDPVGSGFTVIKLTGAECALPKENKVTGTLGVAIDNNDTVTPTVLASEAVQTLLGSKLLFGTFPAQLKGEAKGGLTDAAHVGKTVGVC